MKDLLFLGADLWMVFAGFYCGWRFLREYGNYLLGLEWMIVATSGVNYLIWALRGADEANLQGSVVYFFDSFSRGIGITLILVMGLMRVTHRYKPSVPAEVGVFALATAAGFYLMQFGGYELHVGPATFFVAVNALTTLFLTYFSWHLWSIGLPRPAVWAGLATTAGLVIAITYDFFPFPFDDEHRTIFAIAALATWGTQLFVYFFAYRALHNHNAAEGLEPVAAQVAGGAPR